MKAFVLLTSLVLLVSHGAFAVGGSKSAGGGGGGSALVESRVTGYVAAIDYSTGTISIGASYYGSGALKVTSATKISTSSGSSEFGAIKLGDWAEVRYIWSTKEATKISVTAPSP